MDHFEYRDGRLFCEQIDLSELAHRAGTPLYVYSAATLLLHYDRLAQAFAELNPLICFSVKSCPNIHVLRLLASRGSGLDVVSGGELYRARMARVPMDKVVYAGVGKTDDEIRDALGRLGDDRHDPSHVPDADQPIGLFNIESESEFQTLASIARSLGAGTPEMASPEAALRVNPDVDPKTHKYTSTGLKETKFGVDLERARAFFARFGRDRSARLTGLHLHLGSPITDPNVYVRALEKSLALSDDLERDGFPICTLDIGGGFAADYTTGLAPSFDQYARAIVPMLRERAARGLRIILEPGRTICANAGVLLARVLYVKESGDRKFVVCDAGMHTLIRPALYGAFHFIWPAAVGPDHEPTERALRPNVQGTLEECDVVGPVCESGDFLAKDRPLPPVARGDLLTVFGAGAYGMSMASRYNSHPLPAEILVDGDQALVVRRRESYEDLVMHELEAEEL
ncbi:MAG: diaminopimelate decarboxylase [Phycisphaerales bacterium]|nr:diaminopimelate decarboxylase [Phycisphaerales bacterium]